MKLYSKVIFLTELLILINIIYINKILRDFPYSKTKNCLDIIFLLSY